MYEKNVVDRLIEVIRADLASRENFPIKDLQDQNSYLVGYLSSFLTGQAAVNQKLTEDIEWRIEYHKK
jgi:hypothetical protein